MNLDYVAATHGMVYKQLHLCWLLHLIQPALHLLFPQALRHLSILADYQYYLMANKSSMTSAQSNVQTRYSVVDLLREPMQDFSSQLDITDGTSDGVPQDLLKAPAQQYRPGGKTMQWFDITFKGAKLNESPENIEQRISPFMSAMKNYPDILESQVRYYQPQDAPFDFPRNEKDVDTLVLLQVVAMLRTISTGKRLKAAERLRYQWLPELSIASMTQGHELRQLRLSLEAPGEATNRSPDSATTSRDSLRVDMNFVASARLIGDRMTRSMTKAIASTGNLDNEGPPKDYLKRGCFWTVKSVKEYATGKNPQAKERLKTLLPVELKRYGSLRRVLFEVLAFGGGLALSNFDKPSNERLLEQHIATYEEEKRCTLEPFQDTSTKVQALRGTVSMIQQVVRYATDYGADTVLLTDYASCVVITIPQEPDEYKGATLKWYFCSQLNTGGTTKPSKDPLVGGTLRLVMGAELWHACQRFAKEMEEYINKTRPDAKAIEEALKDMNLSQPDSDSD
ncbi:hypothetical protein BC629DRAFT_1488589 [Irpex lacteus]|nr:hypothetical protein BC629DRAFT_1488589 [Irpex lacteus]